MSTPDAVLVRGRPSGEELAAVFAVLRHRQVPAAVEPIEQWRALRRRVTRPTRSVTTARHTRPA